MKSLQGGKQLNVISDSSNNELYNLDALFGPIVKKNKYRIEFKIKIVDFLREKEKEKDPKINYRKKIMDRYNIPKQTLSDWFKNYENYIATTKTNNYRLEGGGIKNKLHDIEKDILLWIIHLRKAGFAVSIKIICAYIYSLDDNYKKYSYDILRQTVQRILIKNGLTIRNASHIGQPLPEEAKDLVYSFLYEVINKRRYLEICDDKLYLIVNCDETAVYYEEPETKTIDICGNKEIIINTDGSESKRVSVLLTIVANGSKLNPFLIFTGEPEKTNEKKFSEIKEIKNNTIHAVCQKKGWCDTQTFIKWYEKVYLKYEKFTVKEKCLLILDKFS